MEINFTFLEEKREYDLFAGACTDAEKILTSSPVMSAVASRKALELCVKWVYSIDSALKPIEYREGLQSLLHNNGFPSLMDYTLWKRLQYIVKNGNESVHTSKVLGRDDAILSLNILFDFVQWIDYCYGRDYVERRFDETKIPDSTKDAEAIQEQYNRVIKDVQKNADKIVDEKDKEIERLLKMNEELRQQMKGQKSKNQKERDYTYEPNMSEWLTRKRYIDADLRANGYVFDQDAKRNCIEVEYPVVGMPNETGTGYVDYVIWGDTGKIIALLEAKRTSESADKGRNQGKLYADCIQNMQGSRPIIFYTNGFETYLWDDENSAPRVVSGIFPQTDINAMIERRVIRKPVNTVQIDEKITNRWYQLRAVTKCCDNYEKGIRKCLLVMATGTGKTRTAASVVDVMTRSQQMGRVLFLADRKELVKQAKEAFSSYIKNTTMCNLLLNKDEKNANIVFSTYPTILNAIDTMKNSDGSRFFSPGHFDLIIIDEAHRSIFNKYKAIFEYFDACLLGLTATPKKTVHHSTYEFFEMKNNMPTDVYEYDEAVNKDHVLVPFYLIETATQISDDGITYENLDEDEREAYEDEFCEDEGIPEHIPPERINKYIFNKDTADKMISDLMTNGIKHKNGNHVGKSIIFAQNKRHAKFIVERFDKLYPQYKGAFCKLVICDEPYAEKNLEDFKKPDEYPFITVTVDMLETGIDVPEITNLIFAKKVYSRIKFDQMIGRGTRLCDNLFGDGENKTGFYVFDYMRNFQFFDEHPKGKELGLTIAPVTTRFIRMVQIIKLLQDANYAEMEYQTIRNDMVEHVVGDVQAMNPERIEVRLELRYVEQYKVRKEYECLNDVNKEEIIAHLAGLVVSDEKDEAAINFDVTMYGLMLAAMVGKNFGKLKRHVANNANILLSDCATIPDVKAKIPELKELTKDSYWNAQDILKFEETRKSLRDIMKFIPEKKVKTHYTDFEDEVVFRVEGRKVDMTSSDFDDYRAKVNEYVEAHKSQPAIDKLIHNKPISPTDYKELERIFTEELGTAEDYQINYQDTPFGLLIRKIAKMDRDAAYAAFSTFIAEERPNAEQIHFIGQVVDYVVENGYINNVLDLMNAPFDRPYKFSMIFTREEQMEFVKIINSIKSNALVA
jgi:type I restriction enzyme R subunit